MDKNNLPKWRQELKASQRKEGKLVSNKWIQLATVNKSNQPRVRTVVFRGWNKENSIIIYNDFIKTHNNNIFY